MGRLAAWVAAVPEPLAPLAVANIVLFSSYQYSKGPNRPSSRKIRG